MRAGEGNEKRSVPRLSGAELINGHAKRKGPSRSQPRRRLNCGGCRRQRSATARRSKVTANSSRHRGASTFPGHSLPIWTRGLRQPAGRPSAAWRIMGTVHRHIVRGPVLLDGRGNGEAHGGCVARESDQQVLKLQALELCRWHLWTHIWFSFDGLGSHFIRRPRFWSKVWTSSICFSEDQAEVLVNAPDTFRDKLLEKLDECGSARNFGAASSLGDDVWQVLLRAGCVWGDAGLRCSDGLAPTSWMSVSPNQTRHFFGVRLSSVSLQHPASIVTVDLARGPFKLRRNSGCVGTRALQF